MQKIAPLAWLALAMLLASCSLGPGQDQFRQPLPSLRDLRSNTNPAARLNATGSLGVLVRCFDLPLAASLDKAWAAVSCDGLEPAMVEQWRANGLRVGVLEKSQIQKFTAALPAPLRAQEQRLLATGSPLPLAAAPPLNQRRQVVLAGQSGESAETLPPGQPQFLVDLEPAPAGVMLIELTPHHFAIKPSLVPRSPLETQYDGRVFKAWRLHAELPSNQVLVVAFAPPPPSPETPASQPAEMPDEKTMAELPMAELTTPLKISTSQPAPPTRLGDLLLTAARQGQPIQSLLILGTPDKSK